MLPPSSHSVLLLFLVEVVQLYFSWQPAPVPPAFEPTTAHEYCYDYVASVAVAEKETESDSRCYWVLLLVAIVAGWFSKRKRRTAQILNLSP